MIERHVIALTVVVALSAVSCGRGGETDARDAKAASGVAGDAKSSVPNAAASGSAAAVPKTQIAQRDPCAWISAADAARALGDSLASAPTRVRNAESPMPSPDGEGCLYQLRGASKPNVAIQVIPDETGTLQTAFGGMSNVEKEFRSSEARGDTLVQGMWDFVSVIPGGLVAAKKGRVAIELVSPMGMTDRAMRLAAAIVNGIPDLPFTLDAADPSAASGSPDPCALITRQEAEALMGPLTTAPFRSRKSSALAHGAGPSCTYFTGKHRALVVTPTLRRGATLFQMLGGASALVAGRMGGATAPDTLDGPWDQIATGSNGSLNVLKNDKMLSMQFQSSAANYMTAIKLARLAIPRL